MKYLSHSDILCLIKKSFIVVLCENYYQNDVNPIEFIRFDNETECFEYFYDHFDWFISLCKDNKNIFGLCVKNNVVHISDNDEQEINMTFQTSKHANNFYDQIKNAIAE